MLELSPAASFRGSSDVQVMYTFESVMSGMPKRQLSAVMSTRVTWSGAAPPLVVGPVSLVVYADGRVVLGGEGDCVVGGASVGVDVGVIGSVCRWWT
ncbi:hypothetical protein PINS_up021453 [Pythium insidiosum]|nr:hypothetical protein PINS_up021453 [Pythium insidiosum]